MNCCMQIKALKTAIDQAEAIVVGAGSGLSTSAGFTYAGERFEACFADFIQAYHYRDMYSAGFYPYASLEAYWGYWCRHIYYNRYVPLPKTTYGDLLSLVKDKDYFVITTNVDHCFQKTGFDRKRLFYTQGDYGLFQCSEACHPITYRNEARIMDMMKQQKGLEIPTGLVPWCPVCGKPMMVHLRCDDRFVEDEGWLQASKRYADFLAQQQGKNTLYLELGVGGNTPGIIKYPFWRMVKNNPKAVYICVNRGEAYAPKEIEKQSICMDGDIDQVLKAVKTPKAL